MTLPIEVVEDAAGLADRAAEIVAGAATEAMARAGRFAVALAGGGTPRATHERLAGAPYRARIDWARVEIFWGDERCVPPDDPASNHRMARETLLDRVPVPAARVHRVRGEEGPERAAALYEQELGAAFPGEPWPRLDLVLLGLGEDGHTASLFPGSPALEETARWAVATTGPKPPPRRVTLTLPALSAARRVLFLASGAAKAEALRRILAGEDLPAARVRPAEGGLLWLVDRAALSIGKGAAPPDAGPGGATS